MLAGRAKGGGAGSGGQAGRGSGSGGRGGEGGQAVGQGIVTTHKSWCLSYQGHPFSLFELMRGHTGANSSSYTLLLLVTVRMSDTNKHKAAAVSDLLHACCSDQQEEEEEVDRSGQRGQHANHHRLGGWEAFSIPTRGGDPTHDGEGEGGGLQHGGLYGGKPAPAATWHQVAGPLCRHW